MKPRKIFILPLKPIKISLIIIFCFILIWGTTKFVGRSFIQNDETNGEYVILAANETGMHCIQPNYSAYLILPPANNLQVQVFKKQGSEAELVNSGITVEYEVDNNTYSADKINFWKYAADYGYDVPPDVGITGSKLKGTCQLSDDKKYYTATAIPLTPFNDGSRTKNPYQTARITVKDAGSGQVLSVLEKVVLPVSDEMLCSTCHGKIDTDVNILQTHDRREGTNLYVDLKNSNRHSCNECHKDNILSAPGKPGLPSLSLAMHGFHADKMGRSTITPSCYNCHPGLQTKCLRGVMSAANISCNNPGCHGTMEDLAQTLEKGREAWLQEPDCGNCHGPTYKSNINTLYRNSYLLNSPAEEMNDKIKCLSCHNGTHAEWPSTLKIDNAVPTQLQGEPTYIKNCTVCHQGSGRIHQTVKGQ